MTYTLTQEEMALLESDPKTAGVAKKLKEAEERGEFVPKSKFAEEIAAKKELEARLKAIDDTKKAEEEERLRKAGEHEKVIDGLKKEKETLTVQLATTKKDADAYQGYRVEFIKAVKEKIGEDKWLKEYDDFSLESLQKISGVDIIKVGVDTTPPPKPKLADDLQQQLEAAKKAKNQLEVVRLIRLIAEERNKNQ